MNSTVPMAAGRSRTTASRAGSSCRARTNSPDCAHLSQTSTTSSRSLSRNANKNGIPVAITMVSTKIPLPMGGAGAGSARGQCSPLPGDLLADSLVEVPSHVEDVGGADSHVDDHVVAGGHHMLALTTFGAGQRRE